MLIPRRYLRSGAVLLSFFGLVLLLFSNSAVLPIGKPAWAPWFGEPMPPTSRDIGKQPKLPETLTLHLVPHSHSDIGWNLSFEGYYHSIVRSVLRQMVHELWSHPHRRFTWGDLAFLDLWMAKEGNENSGLKDHKGEKSWKQVLQILVHRGQLDIVGGTYVSPDEGMATWWAHNTIVDTGHRTMHRLLKTNTSVAWQIDNFGHFNTLPYLLSNSGYSSLVLGRMAYRDLYDFSSKSRLQFQWQTPDKPGTLFTHFLSTHYASPSKLLDFDNSDQCDVKVLLNVLRRYALTQVRQYPAHGQILVMMGDDFRYTNAKRAFECIDQLVAARSLPGISLRYSTPTEYLSSVARHSEVSDLYSFQGDFYPYQDKPYEQYWSGILASRPALKGLIRSSEQVVQHTEALLAVAKLVNVGGNMAQQKTRWDVLETHLEYCRKQVSIGYHHDAITGTCSDATRYDYVQRLEAAQRVALRISWYALQLAAYDTSTYKVGSAQEMDRRLRKDRVAEKASHPLGYNTANVLAAGIDEKDPQDTKAWLDIPARVCSKDACPGSLVTVTNAALLVSQNQIVRLLVDTLDTALVDAANGHVVTDVQVDRRSDGRYLVSFLAKDIPGLGFRSYMLSRNQTKDAGSSGLLSQFADLAPRPSANTPLPLRLSKGHLLVDLAVHGYRVRLLVKDTGTGQTRVVWHSLNQYFANPRMQSSGAYVMHSFMLMYATVIYFFGVSFCVGLALSYAMHRGGYLTAIPFSKAMEIPCAADYLHDWSLVDIQDVDAKPETEAGLMAETIDGDTRMSADSSYSGMSLGTVEQQQQQQRDNCEYKPQHEHGGSAANNNPQAVFHAMAGSAVGCLFMYFIGQVTDIARLDKWSVGQGHVFWQLVLPSFTSAYVVSGTMRWTARQTVLFICALAAGVVLTIFGLPSWQSRPLAATTISGQGQMREQTWSAKPLMVLVVEHGNLCDSARIWIDHQTEVTYSVCADKPTLVQVTTSLSADVNREVVAQFEIEQPVSLGQRLFGCEFDIFNGVDVVRRRYSRWTPIPGNYYPAISHVALASASGIHRHSGHLTLHSRQAMGVTCIRPNTIETMLHRSMSGNDFRGLVEPMVDPVPATITQFIDLGFGNVDQSSMLQVNSLINTPPMVFSMAMDRNQSLALFTAVGPNAKSLGALNLVGLQVSDTDLLNIEKTTNGHGSVKATTAVAKLYVRLQALPSTSTTMPVSIPAAEFLSVNSIAKSFQKHVNMKVYVVEGGDWSIAPTSTRERSLRLVEDLEIPPGQQKLYQIDMQGTTV
ncbi:mannosyl-oligosaccharide 1,3-1,6-alpha-mannosidase activity protein [Coemansia sp. IMI 203386]|nr:mannosyl-oligosaccharide 1,3-1,6-alpha-mannosidase activity protein [Coemansia sp. IMI 203386]